MSMRPVRVALALVLGLAGVAVALPAVAIADDGSPVRVAIAVPLEVPSSTTPFIPADVLEQYTSTSGLLTRQLDAIIDQPVAIGIDPMILASIRVLGSSVPESATLWLARLAAASNETFPLAYSDSDLTLAIQAGSSAALAPLTFDFAIDPALFAPAVDPTASPTPDPDAQDAAPPTLPSSESLVEWPYTIPRIAWPVANTVTTDDFATLATSGYTSTILSSGNLTRDPTSSSAVSIGDQAVLVSDDTVSAAIGAAISALGTDDWESAMSTVSTAIGAAGRVQSGQATVFATLDRSVPLSLNRIADTLGALEADGTLSMVPMSQALGAPSSAATIADRPHSPEAVDQVARLLLAEQGEQRFAEIAADPTAITSERRLELLRLTSTAWQGNQTGLAGATDDFIAASVALRDSVQLVKSSSLNFFADSASIPIYVQNSLDQAVTVYINVHPETALLAIEDRSVKLEIEPNSQGKGEVPAQAIANGTVQLTVSLSAASGEVIGASTSTRVNVQAGWETPVVAALAVLVIGVFGFGIVRNILKRRRKPVISHPSTSASSPDATDATDD